MLQAQRQMLRRQHSNTWPPSSIQLCSSDRWWSNRGSQPLLPSSRRQPRAQARLRAMDPLCPKWYSQSRRRRSHSLGRPPLSSLLININFRNSKPHQRNQQPPWLGLRTKPLQSSPPRPSQSSSPSSRIRTGLWQGSPRLIHLRKPTHRPSSRS